MDKAPILLRRPVFAGISLVLAAMFGFWSRHLFVAVGKSTEFQVKLGEYALQIAVIVLAGAAIKEFVDWRTARRLGHAQRADLRAEFLRRLRAIHMAVLNAQDLMRAHDSPKTWSEQSRRLIECIPALEEIGEDLRVAPGLFGPDQDGILQGVEGMVTYLKRCRDEYVAKHRVVTSDWKAGKTLADTIASRAMSWTNDFKSGEGTFQSGYVADLLKAKLPMRRAVFASTGATASSGLTPQAIA